MTIDIVYFPIKNGGSFNSYVSHYQRVSLIPNGGLSHYLLSDDPINVRINPIIRWFIPLFIGFSTKVLQDFFRPLPPWPSAKSPGSSSAGRGESAAATGGTRGGAAAAGTPSEAEKTSELEWLVGGISYTILYDIIIDYYYALVIVYVTN